MARARGRTEWRVASERLTLRRRYGSNVKDVLEARRLLLDSSTDSDGDIWYELFALPRRRGAGGPPPACCARRARGTRARWFAS